MFSQLVRALGQFADGAGPRSRKRRRLALVSSFRANPRQLLFERLEPLAMLAAGDLDPSFDLDGRVTTDFFGNSDEGITDIAIQSDGKILAFGPALGTGTNGYDFALARYNADGTLDTNFGPDGTGKVKTNIEGHDATNQIAIQADGKIVAVGTASGAGYIAVARYNTDGRLDTTFGDNGTKKIDVVAGAGANIENGVGIAFQDDGKIIVVGAAWTTPFSNQDIVILRLKTDGCLDTSFGIGGVVLEPLPDREAGIGVAVVENGKIVVGARVTLPGRSDNDFALLRYNPDGSRDTSFGTGGVTVTDVNNSRSDDYVNSLAVQGDGKIVLAGQMDAGGASHFAVLRYNSNGIVDSAFGNGGVAIGANLNGYANAVALQGDGKIVAVGPVSSSSKFGLVRYNSDGNLDNDFGDNGRVVTEFPGGAAAPFSVAIQGDGRIVSGGYYRPTAQDPADFALARYLVNQAPDAHAGGPYTVVQGGTVQLDASSSSDPDQSAASLSYAWDFDGDNEYDDATGINPTFSAQGLVALAILTVGLRVTDNGGLTDTATATITVVVAAIQPDPCDPSKLALVVGGTPGDDFILITPGLGAGHLVATVISDTPQGADITIGIFKPTATGWEWSIEAPNGSLSVFTAPTGGPINRIIALGQAGNDDIHVFGSIAITAELHGGAGNDRLKGGAGHDSIFGEEGDDLLVGGGGRDLLIGGTGEDRIVGNADDDILIAGTTNFDQNHEALCAIMDEWTSSRNYATRTANLRGTGSGASYAARLNGNHFLNVDPSQGPVTVLDDNNKDTLTGDGGQDWFFANLFLDNGDDATKKDKITDLHASEFAADLDFILSE